jgi:hypothetical protein
MKNLLLMTLIVSTVILASLNSCSKDDPIQSNGANGSASVHPLPLNLTTYRWEERGSGTFVNTFKNVIPPQNANYWLKIYLVTNGTEILINRPIRFMDGAIWATSTPTDIEIVYRGNSEIALHLNIKVVFE